MVIVSLIFLVLAAICNAVMDVVSHHYYESVFNVKKFKSIWWNPEVSWICKYKEGDPALGLKKIWIFDMPFTDAWHAFKSLMIVFLCASIVFAWIAQPKFDAWWYYVFAFIFLGFAWNMVFNLFYNKILRKK